jgi:hypothetical protein
MGFPTMGLQTSSTFTDATREKWFPKDQAESHEEARHPVDAFLDQLRMSWVTEWQDAKTSKVNASQAEVTR